MQEINYADAGVDMKKLGIFFIRKCWMLLLAAVIGAVAGGMIYTIVCMVPESEREYQAVSKIYLDFASDETGEVYQAYNGYTWNELMVTDPILDLTMGYLSEDYTREEVAAATEAEILSDLRLLTVTITTHDADRCNMIMLATEKALVARGDAAKEFKSIEVIRSTGAELVMADDRTVQAVLMGLVIATVLTLFGMLFYYVLDDRIFVAGDLKIMTGLSFIGYVGADGLLGRDYDDNFAYLQEKIGAVSILPVTRKTLKADDAGIEHNVIITQEKWKELRDADGVIVTVEYGAVHAAYLAYLMEQLKFRECRVAGIAITGADANFLSRYYGRAVGRR